MKSHFGAIPTAPVAPRAGPTRPGAGYGLSLEVPRPHLGSFEDQAARGGHCALLLVDAARRGGLGTDQQDGHRLHLSTLQAADTHGSADAPKCARQRGPFRTQEHLVRLALEMDLHCFIKARALVRLRVFSYSTFGVAVLCSSAASLKA